jgi:hypothetical protein
VSFSYTAALQVFCFSEKGNREEILMKFSRNKEKQAGSLFAETGEDACPPFTKLAAWQYSDSTDCQKSVREK